MKKLVKLFTVVLCVYAVFQLQPMTAHAGVAKNAKVVGKHAYKVYDIGMTYQEAKEYCKKIGGHLVTITSSSEQKTVAKLVAKGKRNNYWMGAEPTGNGNWTWVTNEKFKYTHWANNQPDSYGSENALMMYRVSNPMNPCNGGEWNDLRDTGECNGESFFGSENFGFICEWELKSPATPKVTSFTKKNGKIIGTASKNSTIYFKVTTKDSTTTYNTKATKEGTYLIKIGKQKKGQTIKIWAKNSYKLKSKVLNYKVK